MDRNGEEIYTATPRSEVVMKEETAFLTTSMLRDVVTPRHRLPPARLSGYNVSRQDWNNSDDARPLDCGLFPRLCVFSVDGQ